MTGRGTNRRWFVPSDNPIVSIGLKITTSPPKISAAETEVPFYVVVEARILKTPHPEKSVTMCISRTPLENLIRKNFTNMVCTTNPDKKIVYMSVFSDCYTYDCEDFTDHEFITIPPMGQGTYVAKHQVPQKAVQAADLNVGEKYSFNMTEKFLGTFWWDFGALDDFDGRRIRRWGTQPEFMTRTFWRADEEYVSYIKELMMEHIEKYGTWNVAEGQDPHLITFVDESGTVEFEVV